MFFLFFFGMCLHLNKLELNKVWVKKKIKTKTKLWLIKWSQNTSWIIIYLNMLINYDSITDLHTFNFNPTQLKIIKKKKQFDTFIYAAQAVRSAKAMRQNHSKTFLTNITLCDLLSGKWVFNQKLNVAMCNNLAFCTTQSFISLCSHKTHCCAKGHCFEGAKWCNRPC